LIIPIPLTLWVRCLRVRVGVEQNIPTGNPCHALVGSDAFEEDVDVILGSGKIE
jgi:hypothetical protein